MISKEILEKAVKNSKNIFGVCQLINLRPTNNNYDYVKKCMNLYNIDYSHFDNENHNSSIKVTYTDDEIFKIHNHFMSTDVVKRRLLKGYKEYKCECCGISEWNGNPIVLQLHHINRNRCDDRLENLQLLCPNCHSQTDNFCFHDKKYAEPLIKKCECCGKEFEAKYKQQRFCSKECVHKSIKDNLKIQITKEKLIEDLIECNYVIDSLRKKYNVSFMTIQNYCKRFGIPYRSADLKEYINKYYK
jgi:hypothetical protein